MTGISEIDSQQQALLANVSALKEEVALGGNLHRALETLKFLAGYVTEHFAAEEEYMRSRGYPGLPEHRAIHEAFVREYIRRNTDFEANGPSAALLTGLSEWLDTWLHEHIREVDTELVEYIRSHCHS